MKRWLGAAKGALLGAAAALSLAATPTASFAGWSPPPQAAAVGYNSLTFWTAWDWDKWHVDWNHTGSPGYQWYFSTSSPSYLNSDGSITVAAYGANNGIMSTVTRAGSSWHGMAFGGGAYIEVWLAFDPTNINYTNGWPQVWGYSLEHMEAMFDYNTAHDQWIGQAPGYEHFIEPDIMEQLSNSWWYSGYFHDWWGIYNRTCGGYCQVGPPWYVGNRAPPTGTSTNYNTLHRYGLLWVPATATTQGYLQYYFDGQVIGRTQYWSQYDNQAPPPGVAPWTYGVIDKQHLALVMGAGATSPMHVWEVAVWQASAANDLHQ